MPSPRVRRLIRLVAAGLVATGSWAPTERAFAATLVAPAPPALASPSPDTGADPGSPAHRLIAAARAQEGVTTRYDGAYVPLAYPGGDVPRDRGVCTDVVVRAYRDAFGLDLQKAVHEDMKRAFAAYPGRWGLSAPDAHIDHRRVPNLQTFFTRHGRRLPVTNDPSTYAPGDLVTQTVAGTLPHVVIVTGLKSPDGTRPLVVHNIGRGTRLEDTLFAFPITGHYRWGLPEETSARR